VTTAPVADQLRLLEVQALDTRAAQIAHQREGHPARAAVEAIKARLAEIEAKVVDARTAVSDTNRELRKAEADVEQVRTRAARDQARVDSGAVSVKDVQALSSELEALARRQGVLEEIELEIMERLEEQESALAALTAEQESLAAHHAAAAADLEDALADLDRQSAEAAEERARAAEGLDPALVALYDKVRAQHGGLGVAPLRGRRCEGCRLELNSSELAQITAAPPEEVLRCDECGRILVRESR
jgi:predicted  nucleic acid-binding Zn-ribbon protein